MRSKLLVAVTALCLLSLAVDALAKSAASSKSAVGSWKLNLQKSSFTNMTAPKFEHLAVTADAPAALNWHLNGMSSNGVSYVSSYNGPIDGKYHPLVSSQSAGARIAYTRTVAGGVSWTMKDNKEAVIEAGIAELSPDGKTLTLKGSTQGPTGKGSFVSVFDRER